MPSKALPRRFAPPGWPIVIPRLVLEDAEQFVEFAQAVFGAKGEFSSTGPAQMWLGKSMLMVTEIGARPAAPGFLYVYVRDADATYRRAMEAGARSREAPASGGMA